MKTIISFFVSSIILVSLCNAQIDTTQSSHKIEAFKLFKKAKHQKTAATILLIGGTGLIAEAFIYAINNIFTSRPKTDFLVLGAPIGLSASLASIPLFIVSGKNKRKAKLMIKNESVLFTPQLNLKENFIAVGIKIKL